MRPHMLASDTAVMHMPMLAGSRAHSAEPVDRPNGAAIGSCTTFRAAGQQGKRLLEYVKALSCMHHALHGSSSMGMVPLAWLSDY